MARIHSHKRGKSHSTRPAIKRVPEWITYGQDELITIIVKMGREGLTPSQIGQKLKDEYGVPLVKPILKKSITQILEENHIKAEIPEDLQNLLRRAQRLREHLSRHRSDRRNVRSLELLEAKIHRLEKYYKKTGKIPEKWGYKAVVAQLA
ncbi:MAG: 30S ribosomal protein S15 [Nitrososphaerales archaeon]